ncbi:hypothetical protein MNBD_BACTEROID04-109, partial [hydrothermal vent metagenome]
AKTTKSQSRFVVENHHQTEQPPVSLCFRIVAGNKRYKLTIKSYVSCLPVSEIQQT